ncbi:TetR/AcrR family transcriptional regulator [Pseudomonas juntendi]|uniref:TetR/AcrR family transcriptional regulator n=2 Tax=Pseudomonas TaxID=286 RepID=A0A7W2LXM8_9PSED|nr:MULTISPECIES: TetR/AcrR family transcriptional regulator [Pseudomonas]MCQ1991499.1 TetR/AcrR family transcriptional regulator [Pseudomonas sp. Eb3]MRT59656.1 TetR/AcrR family transcriptional regulator [Pseudomonas sp. CAH-1]EGB96673.2 TetR family transcriptional regulator [Pseudomonas sp. TJI-51]MBA6121214.1 TetR/AcrR family transcriptional regulator [Pseudomonas juntendi]MBA6128173.1 TetR/AcrR family transcriptional regulator [Pseudomonas juntendi]
MSGLRERQMELRRQAISEAAIELFRDQGYAQTSIDQIAKLAGVSSPTVFKYYPSKQEILLGLLQEADQRAVLDLREVMHQFEDPVDLLCHLESLLISYSLKVLPAPIWAELLPLVLSGGVGLPDSYHQMNHKLQGEIANVLRALQEAGKLRADLDVELAAFLLNDYSHVQLMRLVKATDPDREEHNSNVRRITSLLFHGMKAG